MRTTTKQQASLIAIAAAFLAGQAEALTPPGTGAAPFPPTVALSWPFPAGESVHILSGYGPSAGSSLHRDRNATHKANDHFALDLTLPDHPRHGHGQPVLAPVSGTVIKAGWATSGWANYGQRVILEHDDAFDGHRYTSIYAHLDSVAVVEGQRVQKGEPLGTLGGSCQGQRSCLSFSTPHLHWAIHRDAAIGGSGTGGAYAGNAVVPEIIDGAENLARGQVHVSLNRDPSGTPTRPQACAWIPADGGVLDDDGPCFEKAGTPRYWHRESTGEGSGHWWTETFVGTTPDNTARFQVAVDVAGTWDLYASIPAGATATAAQASVKGALGVEHVTFSQSTGTPTTARRWVKVATVDLVPEVLGNVTFLDTVATGAQARKRVVVDALAVLPAGTPPPAIDDAPPTLPPLPAGPCTLSGDELVVEEDGACATAAGNAAYWYALSSGSGGRARFTHAVAAATDDNSITWTAQARGRVEVLARVPSVSTSRQARYVVQGRAVVVDQQARAGQLVSLGLFDVDGDLTVRLGDNTGEPFTGSATAKKLGFDALTLRQVQDPTRQSVPADGGADADDKAASDAVAVDEVDVDGAIDADPFAEDDTVAVDVTDVAPEVTGGCSAGSGAPLALALIALLRGRRRR
jgi:murein DD-endopeptidase MepM/ murein hydrolase activator NlpD